MATQREKIADICARLCTTYLPTESTVGDAMQELCAVLGQQFRDELNRRIDRRNERNGTRFGHI